MERHLNVLELGMRVSLIKPELPSLHIHSKRDRRAGRGRRKKFSSVGEKCLAVVMLQKECVWGRWMRASGGGKKLQHRRTKISKRLVFTHRAEHKQWRPFISMEVPVQLTFLTSAWWTNRACAVWYHFPTWLCRSHDLLGQSEWCRRTYRHGNKLFFFGIFLAFIFFQKN